MLITRTKTFIDNIYYVKIEVTDITTQERDLLEKYGEPLVDLGGDFESFTAPHYYRKFYSFSPHTYYNVSETKVIDWLDTVEARIHQAVDFLKGLNDNTWTGTIVHPLWTGSFIRYKDGSLQTVAERLDNIELTLGPEGPQGPQGEIGPEGPQGPQGVSGIPLLPVARIGDTTYNTLAAALSASVSGETIIVYRNITEGGLFFKDGVNIHLENGITWENPNNSWNISDNSNSVTCKITGNAIIKNTSVAAYGCIYLGGANTSLEIKCSKILSKGTVNPNSFSGLPLMLNNFSKFWLECDEVGCENNGGIYMGNSSADINVKIKKIWTGVQGDATTGSSAFICRGNGFVNIDEIVCYNLGHCFSLRGGTVRANIRKMTTYNNHATYVVSTLILAQGTGTQVLHLTFDSIENIGGSHGYSAIEAVQGVLNARGRYVANNFDSTIFIKDGMLEIDEVKNNNNWCGVVVGGSAKIKNSRIIGAGGGAVVPSYNFVKLELTNCFLYMPNNGTSIWSYDAPHSVHIYGKVYANGNISNTTLLIGTIENGGFIVDTGLTL